MYEQFKELADVDITKGPMEVGPTTHYVMGGIRVEPDSGATTVPGLFAAGECAGGMHGANRLGGNSLSDLLVFGARAGAGATRHAVDQPSGEAGFPHVDPVQVREATRDLAAPLERAYGDDPYAIQRDLQATMQSLVGIFRVQADLDEALTQLAAIRERGQRVQVAGGRSFNPGWDLAFELRNLITVSEAITRSARQRTESRGAHSRLDHPDTDDARWGGLNSVVARAEDGTMAVTTSSLPTVPDELRALLGTAH